MGLSAPCTKKERGENHDDISPRSIFEGFQNNKIKMLKSNVVLGLTNYYHNQFFKDNVF